MIFTRKILFQFILLIVCSNSFGQRDSIKKQQIFLSLSAGVSLFTQFTYNVSDYNNVERTAYAKPRPLYSFSFEHNIKHFTINFIYGYTQNEFIGSPYFIQGKYLYTPYHSESVYKKLEIYQKVKYNHFQLGFGLGYNHWIKKHNISITTNILQNIFDRVIVSSNYVKGSQYNDQDTTAILLAKNYRNKSSERGAFTITDLGIYANMKLTYSYALYKNIFLSFTLNGSFGLLDNYSSNNTPYYDNYSLGYRLLAQKTISCSFGVRCKLY